MNNQLTDAEASALTERAFELLTKRLEQFGNILSAPHKKALHGIVEAFSQMTQGELQGRWAVGLAAGLGKSTSVVCWLAALLQHGLQNRVSVAVAAEEVEALCDLWKSLESMGVDMSHVGIKHSKAGARVPSTPDYDQKPILFICHARVRDKYLQQFNTYKGQPRQLLIWDESLIATYSQSCETNILTSIIGSMERLIRRDVDLRAKQGELVEYLSAVEEAIYKEQDRLKEINSTQSVIKLPQVSEEKLEHFKKLTSRYASLQDLFEMVAYPVKVSNFAEKGVVQYQVSVPVDLKNIIILDASGPIRDLVWLDKSVHCAEDELRSLSEKTLGVKLSALKRYDNVTIYRMKAPGGKGAMYKSFKQVYRRNRLISQEVAEVVKNHIPENEAVLLVTFKPVTAQSGEVAFEKLLRADLEAAGVNLRATVDVEEKNDKGETVVVKKPRVRITTWGRHTSTNDHSYCQNEIQIGIVHRSTLDLLGNALGQLGAVTKEPNRKALLDLQLSEVAHCCYQAINRVSCRSMDGLQARPAKVWLIHHSSDLEKKLEPVLQGAVWKEWKKVYLLEETKVDGSVGRIKEYLLGLPEDVQDLPCKRLKQGLGLDVSKDTWQSSLTKAIEGTEWKKVGQRLLRGKALAKALGFAEEAA